MFKRMMLFVLIVMCTLMMNAKDKKKVNKEKKQNKSSKKIIDKVDLQLGIGLTPFKANDLLLKFHGDKDLIKQYAIYNGGTVLSSNFNEEPEQFSSSYILIPLELNVHIYKKFYFQIGYEGIGEKKVSMHSKATVSQSGWSNVNFKNDYDISLKVSWLRFGFEYRHNEKFAAYMNILAGSAKVDMVEEHTFTDKNHYKEYAVNNYDLKGSGLGLALGAKYYKSIGKKGYLKERMRIFLKMEIFISKIDDLNGTINREINNSLGEKFSETVEGSLYKVESSPVGLDWIETAEISPQGKKFRNAEKLSLDFSGIRLGLGIRF